MVVSIYKLVDPVTEEIRYIGITKRTLRVRLQEHVSDAKAGVHSHLHCWIRTLLCSNVLPTIELIEFASEENWQDRERFWIGHYRDETNLLTNVHHGGTGILNPVGRVGSGRYDWTDERKLAASARMKGKPKVPGSGPKKGTPGPKQTAATIQKRLTSMVPTEQDRRTKISASITASWARRKGL